MVGASETAEVEDSAVVGTVLSGVVDGTVEGTSDVVAVCEVVGITVVGATVVGAGEVVGATVVVVGACERDQKTRRTQCKHCTGVVGAEVVLVAGARVVVGATVITIPTTTAANTF